jgi:hypothetical protein
VTKEGRATIRRTDIDIHTESLECCEAEGIHPASERGLYRESKRAWGREGLRGKMGRWWEVVGGRLENEWNSHWLWLRRWSTRLLIEVWRQRCMKPWSQV